jgi:hypothetical protein
VGRPWRQGGGSAQAGRQCRGRATRTGSALSSHRRSARSGCRGRCRRGPSVGRWVAFRLGGCIAHAKGAKGGRGWQLASIAILPARLGATGGRGRASLMGQRFQAQAGPYLPAIRVGEKLAVAGVGRGGGRQGSTHSHVPGLKVQSPVAWPRAWRVGTHQTEEPSPTRSLQRATA